MSVGVYDTTCCNFISCRCFACTIPLLSINFETLIVTQTLAAALRATRSGPTADAETGSFLGDLALDCHATPTLSFAVLFGLVPALSAYPAILEKERRIRSIKILTIMTQQHQQNKKEKKLQM